MTKWVIIVATSLALAACLGATSGPATTETAYPVYKNCSAPQAKALEPGYPVEGVLLKYSSEGDYSNSVKSRNADGFSVYCLFDQTGTNGDGMSFNYVLYIPQDIQDQFKAGGGANPTSGDPFWWYMSTYFGTSLDEIQNNWPATIELLVGRDTAPRARAQDVPATFKK